MVDQIVSIDMSQQYPNTIKVSGFPFSQQGWNNVYVKSDRTSLAGVPIYELNDYTLYGLIGILGTEIVYDGNRWIFRRKRDSGIFYLYSNNELFGRWGNGILITKI